MERPFDQGYLLGITHDAAVMTPRMVATDHPEFKAVDVDEFLNGYEDGIARDSWRYDKFRSLPDELKHFHWPHLGISADTYKAIYDRDGKIA